MKVSPEILNMLPYKPGKPISETQREFGVTEVHKLASNENPLGPSPKAIQAVQNALGQTHRYPDPTFYDLLQKLSKKWAFPVERITIGNGSDELIDLLCRVFCEPHEDAILTTESAFAAYKVRASASRLKTYEVKLKAGMKTDLHAMSDFLDKSKDVRLVFLPNPNNPTGTHLNDSEVQTFLKKHGNRDDLIIVFDEAYTEFVRAKDYRSAFDYARQYSNVVVLKTLSKLYGLAGFRIGVMIAPLQAIDLSNRVRTPFNVNELAQVAALAALDDEDFIKKTCEVTWQGLDYFYKELQRLNLPFIESQGNFVLFDTKRDANRVYTALLKRGVILRPVQNYGLNTHLRMSVGLPHENQFAIKALEEVLKEIKL